MSFNIRVKGQAFRGVFCTLVSTFGEATGDRIVDRMGGEAAMAMRYSAIVSSGWYPVDWYCDLHRAAADVLPEERHLARRIGMESTRRDLAGIYASLQRLMSQQSSFDHAERLVSAYMKGARVSVESPSRSRVVLRCRQMPGLDQRVWDYVVGALSALASAVVGPSAAVRVLDGGLEYMDSMQLEVRWVRAISGENIVARWP